MDWLRAKFKDLAFKWRAYSLFFLFFLKTKDVHIYQSKEWYKIIPKYTCLWEIIIITSCYEFVKSFEFFFLF